MTDTKTPNTGSQGNGRSRLFTVRLSEEEGAAVDGLVERSGLTAGAIVRRALLDAPTASRRPSRQDRAVHRLMAALGKIGSNVHQLAGHADLGCFDEETAESIRYAVRDMAELRFACL